MDQSPRTVRCTAPSWLTQLRPMRHGNDIADKRACVFARIVSVTSKYLCGDRVGEPFWVMMTGDNCGRGVFKSVLCADFVRGEFKPQVRFDDNYDLLASDASLAGLDYRTRNDELVATVRARGYA